MLRKVKSFHNLIYNVGHIQEGLFEKNNLSRTIFLLKVFQHFYLHKMKIIWFNMQL